MYLMVLDLKLIKKGFLIKLLIFSSLTLFSREPLELIIGQETINPGIDLTFEAAIKDLSPLVANLLLSLVPIVVEG